MSSRASLIEVDGQPAGVVAWDGTAYLFHAASKAFFALEGLSFAACGDAELAARRLLRPRPVRRRRRDPARRVDASLLAALPAGA